MISILLGITIGILVGLLPGLGLVTGIMLVFTYLQSVSATEIILFYMAMTAASQFMGSVTAIVLQIPGEANSIFALKESIVLQRENKLEQALGASAIGSAIGGIGAILITITLLNFLEPVMPYFFRSDIKAMLLICSVVLFVSLCENKMIINVCLAICGFVLAFVGVGPYGQLRNLGIDKLTNGIPWYPVLISLFILPQLWMSSFKSNPIVSKAKLYWDTGVIMRSTIAGYIGGLVPGISWLMCSKLAWLLENKISGNPIKRLLAAETGNNAGAYSMIVPLLLLGIPIVNSEAIILELVSSKGFAFNWNNVVASGWLAQTIWPIVLVNISMAAIAYFGIKWLILWYKIPYLKIIMTIVIVSSLFLVSNNYFFDFIILLFFLPIGYILRRLDMTPLVITFLIGDQIEQNLLRVLIIYDIL